MLQLKECVQLFRHSQIADSCLRHTVDAIQELLHINVEFHRQLVVTADSNLLDDVAADHLLRCDIAAVKYL